jgi:hypothetical protein
MAINRQKKLILTRLLRINAPARKGVKIHTRLYIGVCGLNTLATPKGVRRENLWSTPVRFMWWI